MANQRITDSWQWLRKVTPERVGRGQRVVGPTGKPIRGGEFAPGKGKPEQPKATPEGQGKQKPVEYNEKPKKYTLRNGMEATVRRTGETTGRMQVGDGPWMEFDIRKFQHSGELGDAYRRHTTVQGKDDKSKGNGKQPPPKGVKRPRGMRK